MAMWHFCGWNLTSFHSNIATKETRSFAERSETVEVNLADKFPARYILSVLFFIGHICLMVTRNGFSVAVVVMVNSSSKVTPANQNVTYQLCQSSGSGNASAQVAGGLLEQRLGGKIVYGTGMLFLAVLNVLSPVASRTSPWAMFAVRFCMGLVSGVLFPTLFGIWGRWAPPTDRTTLLAICYLGIPLGNIINYPLASFLADELGWEYIFYIPGAFVAAWLVAWLLLAYDSPAKHPRILEKEQKYIEEGIGTKGRQKPTVPWLKILTSPPVWALVIGQFSSNWGVFFLATQLPNYMKNVLGFNIRTNGLLSALPFALNMVSTMASGAAADRLIQGGKIPKVWIRRGFVIIGFAGMVICGVILANLSGCDPVAAVSLLCLTQGFNGLTVAGVRAVHVEFAPRFSGVTYGLANMAGTLSGIFAPLLVGFLTDNYGVGGIVTAVFMRTDVQPWARVEGDVELNIEDKNVKLAGSKDLVIANEHAEVPTMDVEMPSTKL
uniref:Major facilitator superfamily (MFS) profile domain-containing protein n=1 Tax=Branchiostoma floridae TaxID=7739 RepID=C3Y3C9_BRAFL|eukprot:XP_002609186.1 hypothetical protein BRAFLDRAFT_90637 [Branchiostoma floridae]